MGSLFSVTDLVFAVITSIVTHNKFLPRGSRLQCCIL